MDAENHRQNTNAEVKNVYNKRYKSRDERKEALKNALEIRKFEIEMYWKRATYFWTIIAVIFTGYFLLVNAGGLMKYPNLVFLVNCVGFIFSLSWFLVNRGSKFWQNNWERHVDLLEDEFMGPLYKTVIQTGDLKWWHLHKEDKYSVSKVNQLLSLYVVAIWFFVGLNHLIFKLNLELSTNWPYIIIMNWKSIVLAIITICTTYALLHYGKSDPVKQGTRDKLQIDQR
ncbi:hypothetical protein [Paenisporosarcina indica]|uniref:RipA family octameric membrane protein n=1 Tax=Paenisporosarcina indica TaxID=650093 RepID=UPI00094F7EE8|nr:hypothetical protein [Paenisporosarcina indica]